MKTIQEIALGTIFPKEQANTILEIVNATENPEVGLKMLLGIYEQPYIAQYVDHPEKKLLTFKEYDKFKDRVSYTYVRRKQTGIYVNKNADESLINADNYREYVETYNRDTVKHILVTLKEWEIVDDYCHYDTWIKYAENKNVEELT